MDDPFHRWNSRFEALRIQHSRRYGKLQLRAHPPHQLTMASGKIAIWDLETVLPETFLLRPSFPTTEIFSIWLQQMYDLTYVPDFDLGRFSNALHGTTDDKDLVRLETRGEIAAGILRNEARIQDEKLAPIYRSKHEINCVLARRKIFLDHNWPSADYDPGKCTTAMWAFERRVEELWEAVEEAVPMDVRRTGRADPAYDEPVEAYNKFLKDTAGGLAF